MFTVKMGCELKVMSFLVVQLLFPVTAYLFCS